MRNKITIVGAGNVGAACAQRIAEKGYADIVLVDIIEGLPQGKALDILESAPVIGFDSHVTGTNDYEDTANSDVVIITSGMSRKPGMASRDELLLTNKNIVTGVTRNIVKYSPDSIIIMVTNPVDVMTHLAITANHLSPKKVIGLSGVLDGARLRSFIAAEFKVSVGDVFVCVLGEHGKNMVVIPRLCTVGGRPLTEILPREAIDRLVKRTIGGGAEIIDLLKTSAFYAPSAAVTRMVEAIILDRKQVLSCAAYLNGEYGINDNVISVPVKLGRNGIEQIIELELTEIERAQLSASAEAVRQLIGTIANK